MELENQEIQAKETIVVEEKSTQETQPEIKKDEVKEEVKTLTQKQIDDIIEKRLARQKESFQKEQESLIAKKEQELSEKLKTYETDTKTLAEQIKLKDSELTRLRYGIKEDKYDEVLALKDFRMKKDPSQSEEDALKSVLLERPEYIEKTIKQIGIEIKQDAQEIPIYSDEILRMYPFLKMSNK